VPPQAEEVPTAAAAEAASIAPLSPIPVAAVVEGETAVEAPASCAAPVTLFKTGPSGGDAVVIVDEDSVVLPSSGNCDAVIPPVLEPAQVTAIESLLPAAEMSVPSPVVEVQDPPPAVEVAESSSAQVVLTTKEVMELVTCRYIDFPSVGVH
jgi:hypothetical protein